MKFLKALILLLIAFVSLNCDCPPLDFSQKSIQQYIERYPVILKVRGLSEGKNQFSVEVLEVYKGNFKIGQILNGVSDGGCDLSFMAENTYIIFTGNAPTFSASLCSPSFNIDQPTLIPPPPPPLPEASEKEKQRAAKAFTKWKTSNEEKTAKSIILQLEKHKRKHDKSKPY